MILILTEENLKSGPWPELLANASEKDFDQATRKSIRKAKAAIFIFKNENGDWTYIFVKDKMQDNGELHAMAEAYIAEKVEAEEHTVKLTMDIETGGFVGCGFAGMIGMDNIRNIMECRPEPRVYESVIGSVSIEAQEFDRMLRAEPVVPAISWINERMKLTKPDYPTVSSCNPCDKSFLSQWWNQGCHMPVPPPHIIMGIDVAVDTKDVGVTVQVEAEIATFKPRSIDAVDAMMLGLHSEFTRKFLEMQREKALMDYLDEQFTEVLSTMMGAHNIGKLCMVEPLVKQAWITDDLKTLIVTDGTNTSICTLDIAGDLRSASSLKSLDKADGRFYGRPIDMWKDTCGKGYYIHELEDCRSERGLHTIEDGCWAIPLRCDFQRMHPVALNICGPISDIKHEIRFSNSDNDFATRDGDRCGHPMYRNIRFKNFGDGVLVSTVYKVFHTAESVVKHFPTISIENR